MPNGPCFGEAFAEGNNNVNTPGLTGTLRSDQTFEPPEEHLSQEPIDVGGPLASIPEGGDEDVDLTLETFYAELMNDEPLRLDEAYDGRYEFTAPVIMTTEDTVLVMSKEDAEAEDQGLDIQDVQEIFIGETTEQVHSAWRQAASTATTYISNTQNIPTDQDEFGPYIELCFADHM